MEAIASTTIENAHQGDVIEFLDRRPRRAPRVIRGRVGTRHGNGTAVLDCECPFDNTGTASRYTLLDGTPVTVVDR